MQPARTKCQHCKVWIATEKIEKHMCGQKRAHVAQKLAIERRDAEKIRKEELDRQWVEEHRLKIKKNPPSIEDMALEMFRLRDLVTKLNLEIDELKKEVDNVRDSYSCSCRYDIYPE